MTPLEDDRALPTGNGTLIYLVRHGETDWNNEHRIQGTTDVPLNETGREQASTTAGLLARKEWSRIVTSPLSRARETATIIASRVGLPSPDVDVRLVERDYGQAEGLDSEEVQRLFPGDTPVPGREKRSAVARRAIAAFADIARDSQNEAVIVVAHGGLIRSVLRKVDPDGDHGMITNGSVHSFRYYKETLTLIAFDDPIEAESLQGEDVRQQNPMEARK